MKREILFRGKCVDTSEWLIGHYSRMSYCDGRGRNSYIKRDGYAPFEVDDNTIGQYIGLQDKNGTKIFEGDILYARYEDRTEDKGFYETYNEVVFKNGAFGIIGELTGNFLSFDYLSISNEVVCGNIYDNKNLLE